jgi:type IV pilus assembly protein PilQ
MRFETRQDGKFLLVTLLEDGGSLPQGASIARQHFAAGDKAGQSLRDIQFRRGKDGAGIVSVDLSSIDGGVDIYQKGTTLMVSFKKAQLPEQLRRQLDVGDFATPITLIKTRAVGDDVLMEIQPKGLWEHTAFQTDNQFIVEVRPLQEDPGKLFQGSKTGYQGEAISLNFQNIPLRELLHVFADITNFNIVVSDSVAGNVSLRLNDVPWDHALEIVLQQKNLSMRKSGNVLWIAPRDELAARDKLEVEAREAAVAAEHPRMEVFQLNYQKVEEFAAMVSGNSGAPGGSDKNMPIGGFLSAAGKISIDKRTNQAFINDVPSRLELIRDLLKKIDRPARQVMIEARIVEADTGFSKALGVRLGGTDKAGLSHGNPLMGTGTRWGVGGSQDYVNMHIDDKVYPGYSSLMREDSFDVGQPGSYNQIYTTDQFTPSVPRTGRSTFVELGVPKAAGQFALALFNKDKTRLLSLEFSAMESDNKGKTISSPRILTADQVEATIHDGVKIPYLAASASGATSVQFHDAALKLKVKPQITPDGRVLMVIKINKDALGTKVSDTVGYTIKTKEVVSEVHVENGGTIVIGGVFEQTETQTDERIPFFGDLPYVGFLFKKKERYEARKELIIMLTPRIMDDNLSVRL